MGVVHWVFWCLVRGKRSRLRAGALVQARTLDQPTGLPFLLRR